MGSRVQPMIIGVAGGTGSGKTTVTQALLHALGDQAVLLQHDWYYRDQANVPVAERAQVNYDHPDAQETELLVHHIAALRQGDAVVAPQYDFTRHTRAKDTVAIAPHPIVVVEGINTLASEALCAQCDLSVFVDTPADIRFSRRLQRDVEERGRSVESITTQYLNQVRPMHELYVEPCRSKADLVVSGEAAVADSVARIRGRLDALHPRKGTTPRLLLLSNSTMPEAPYLGWAQSHIGPCLAGVPEAIFVPYAAAGLGFDTYTAMVAEVLSREGTRIIGLHTVPNPAETLAGARAIIVGGGNTFCLLTALQRCNALPAIRSAVRNGTPYIGWSAGANLACPTIKTTNDMPVEAPDNFEGLGLLPFQLNPHYTTKSVAGHGGESRDQRLQEYITKNPTVPVLGLPEGTYLAVADGMTTLGGAGEAVWFSHGCEPKPVAPGPLLPHTMA